MDSLSEDSPLLWAILVTDHVQHVFENQKPLIRFASFLLAFYILGGCWIDILMLLGLLCWLHRYELMPSNTEAIGPWTGILTGIVLTALTLGQQAFRSTVASKEAISDNPGRIYLIPSRTTHSRFFPRKHSFSYSYPVVGIPVGFSGSVNGIVSVDVPRASRHHIFGSKAWLNVESIDHLQRGHPDVRLRSKLDDYLRSQEVDPSQYPYAYLVTAARVLGYCFIPVSLWFLYTSEKALSAMVVEFHSVFGERRSYLVERDFATEAKHLMDSAEDLPQTELRPSIKAAWQKDFHLSPFNSRKGSYSIFARDPLGTNMEGFLGIDVTINLVASEGHLKLATRLFSDGDAVEPESVNFPQKFRLIAHWLWTGPFVSPRFVKECVMLFFKRRLHFWYRPEPLKESIGRMASKTERIIEKAFREYLRHLVENSSGALTVRYVSSGIEDPLEEVFRSQLSLETPEAAKYATIKVLTPIFYSRFVHYAHDSEATFCELAESCTLWVDKPEILPKIFLKKPMPPLQTSSLSDYLFFQLIRLLRRRPEKIERPMTSASVKLPTTHTMVDIRGFRISSLDAFVLNRCDAATKESYKIAVTRLFIANRVAFGSLGFLDLILLVGRVGGSWMLTSMMS